MYYDAEAFSLFLVVVVGVVIGGLLVAVIFKTGENKLVESNKKLRSQTQDLVDQLNQANRKLEAQKVPTLNGKPLKTKTVKMNYRPSITQILREQDKEKRNVRK